MAKILLVEDDNNLREIYEARLQAEGYTIVSAQDGEDALVKAKQEKPDLVISDVMMPRVSGFEMLDILRNTEGLKDTKVIMLTALGQAEDKTRADTLGADRYLVKSQVTLEDIVQAADELLKDAGAIPATAAAATTTDASVTPAAATPEPTATQPVVAAVPVATPPAEPAQPVAAEPVVLASPQAAPATVPSPTPEPTPQPEAPETTPEVAPSEKPEQPAVVAPVETAATPTIPVIAPPAPAAVAPESTVTEPTSAQPVVQAVSTPAEPATPTTTPQATDDQKTDDLLMADAVKQLGGTTAPIVANDTATDDSATSAPAPSPATPADTAAPAEPATEFVTEPDATPEPAEATAVASSAADEQALMQKQIDQFVQQQDTPEQKAPSPEPTTAPALEPTPAEAVATTSEAAPLVESAADETPSATSSESGMQQPTVISPDTATPTEPVTPTPEPTPQPEVPETTPEVAPSEKPEQPAVVAPVEAVADETPATSAENDNVTVVGKKIIQPPVEPMHTQPDLNELLAKEGINSLDEHVEPQQPAAPFSTPHQPGHVISPNGSLDAPDLTAPVTQPVSTSEPVAAGGVPNPNDPNNIAL